jgi:tellurite resistance-related uncharacterized protein
VTTPSSGAPEPYRSTPIFDEASLPAGLRCEHRTKPGVWGVVRVLEGSVKLTFVDPPEVVIVSSGSPGVLFPDQPHFVEPVGKMRMQVDFYDQPPEL